MLRGSTNEPHLTPASSGIPVNMLTYILCSKLKKGKHLSHV
jgi:hypothetical protein